MSDPVLDTEVFLSEEECGRLTVDLQEAAAFAFQARELTRVILDSELRHESNFVGWDHPSPLPSPCGSRDNECLSAHDGSNCVGDEDEDKEEEEEGGRRDAPTLDRYGDTRVPRQTVAPFVYRRLRAEEEVDVVRLARRGRGEDVHRTPAVPPVLHRGGVLAYYLEGNDAF